MYIPLFSKSLTSSSSLPLLSSPQSSAPSHHSLKPGPVPLTESALRAGVQADEEEPGLMSVVRVESLSSDRRANHLTTKEDNDK